MTGPAGPPGAGTMPATFLQRGLWPRVRGANVARVRAVRFTGRIELDRLAAAAATVHGALPALGVNLIDRDGQPELRYHGELSLCAHELGGDRPGDPDAACVALLRADRDRTADPDAGPQTRFHLIRIGSGEVVLALVAHELVLDERSQYLVLGAVLQAYQRRFRPDGYRDFTSMPGYHPLPATVANKRRRWWAEWFAAESVTWSHTAPVPSGGGASRRLEITGERWRALASSGGTLRDNGSLGLAAALAWWQYTARARPAPVLSTVLDLRDHFDLGQAVGPLTDHIVFRVDLSGAAARGTTSHREVFRRTQVGVLKATTHYLPYGELVALGTALGRIAPPRTAARWDVHVHLCGNPPGSGRHRGEEDGITAALFREASLLDAAGDGTPRDWDGTTVEVRAGEVGGGVALAVRCHGHAPDADADRLVEALDRIIDTAAADPDSPLPTVTP